MKIQTLSVVVGGAKCDVDDIVTIPNHSRVGMLDRWVAWIRK